MKVTIWHIVFEHVKIISGNVSFFLASEEVLGVPFIIWRELTEPIIHLSKLFFIGKVYIIVFFRSAIISIIRIHLVHNVHSICKPW